MRLVKVTSLVDESGKTMNTDIERSQWRLISHTSQSIRVHVKAPGCLDTAMRTIQFRRQLGENNVWRLYPDGFVAADVIFPPLGTYMVEGRGNPFLAFWESDWRATSQENFRGKHIPVVRIEHPTQFAPIRLLSPYFGRNFLDL